MIRSSDPQIGANQLEFNYQEIEHTLVSVETGEGPWVLVIQSKFGLLETRLTMNLSVRKRRDVTSRTIDSDDCIGGSGDADGIYQESWWVSMWWRGGTSVLFQHLQRGPELPPKRSQEWRLPVVTAFESYFWGTTCTLHVKNFVQLWMSIKESNLQYLTFEATKKKW